MAALSLTCTLVFVSGIAHPLTRDLTYVTEQYVANALTGVGASAAVEPNEYNTITAALTAQRTALDEREAALRERELNVGLSARDVNSSWDTEMVTFVNSVLLFIVLLLLLSNYLLDFRYRWRLVHAPVHR